MTAPPPPATVPLWRRALRALWLAAALVALILILRGRGPEIRAALAAATPLGLAAAALPIVVGVGISGEIWRTLLGGLGSPLPVRAAARVFFVGQLGKFLPGSLWPVLAQVEMGRDLAVPARVSAAAFALFMAVYLCTGTAVAAIALPLADMAPAWLALLAVPALLLLVPGPLAWVLATALRLARRRPLPGVPGGRAMLRAATVAVAMWLLAGLHVRLLAADLGVAVDWIGATGAFAGAWVLGFLLLVAPAGAGAREAVLVGLLAPLADTATALVLALVSRVLATLADVGWALVAAAAARARARSSSAPR